MALAIDGPGHQIFLGQLSWAVKSGKPLTPCRHEVRFVP